MSEFASFVATGSNGAAWTAAIAVAENPGRVHNPLVIYGPIGSGKSHLLRAIHSAMRGTVVRMMGEELIAELVQAIRQDTMDAFRRSLVVVDALLLDDLGVAVRNKPVTREEVLDQLGDLVDAGLQVVVACDLRPSAWLARFPRGFAAELSYLSVDARVAILQRAAAARAVTLRDEDVRRLAREHERPRELQARVARIAAEAAIGR